MSTQTRHLTARAILRAGEWDAAPIDRVRLPYDERFRRRIMLTCVSGRACLLSLAEATVLNDGDALATEAGLVAVEAAPEDLMRVSATDAEHLTRLAWHIGNRHLPAEIGAGYILLRQDHVIADMLTRLGANVERVRAPFSPEGGAYGHGAVHGHDHGHVHGHAHAHSHPHAHDHGADHAGHGDD